MYMLLTILYCTYLVSYSYQINFPGGGGGGVGVAGLIEIKANSASQQSWSWGLAELGNFSKRRQLQKNMISIAKTP